VKPARHRIGTRMGAGLGLILLLMIALVLLGILSMRNINKKMDTIVKRNNKQIWYSNVIKDSVHTIDEAMLTLIQTRNEEWNNFEHVKILTARATYDSALERLEEMERSDKGRELIAKLKTAVAEVRSHVAKATDLTLVGHYREARAVYLNDARSAVFALHQVCSELVTYEEGQSNARYNEAVGTYIAARNIFIAIAALMVLFAVSAAVILTRSITKPIRKGVDIANRLAEGDLDMEIEVENHDETGQLLSSMKNMVERLRQAKELEQQLIESQKLETVGRLAGGIAHDFNNMLNVILGSAQLIKMRPGIDGKTYDRCVLVEDAVARAAGFVRQLLAFSRKQMLELKVIDLCRIVEDFEKMIRRMIGEHIEMVIIRTDAPATVKIDVAQINQVLLNLVVNAREAMPEGGRLIIEICRATLDSEDTVRHAGAAPGDYIALSVADTGTGMDEDVTRNIFEPFYTTKETGTGLGLSVVYGIIRQHGGFLTVESTVGKGTTFKVYLPSAEGVPAERRDDRQQSGTIEGDGTILVVEDDDELRATASELLTILGYNVLTASDGLEGVEVYREHHKHIDLVLLDMVMPRMGGYEAYQEMRKIEPSVPSLFVTGYNMTDTAAGLNGENGIEAIQKPYTVAGLSSKIKEIIGRKSCIAA